RLRGRDAARLRAGSPRPRHARAPGLRPGRPPRARQRRRAAAAHGGPAAPARRVRADRERGDVQARRGLLREAEERLPLSLLRASVVVPGALVEEATAAVLELFPEGFEELSGAEATELVAFTDEAGAERLRARFDEARVEA